MTPNPILAGSLCRILRADAAHAEVFDFEEFLDAVFRLRGDAAFLHAAERGDLGRDDALVDADDAVFGRRAGAADAAAVGQAETPLDRGDRTVRSDKL
jgi:hypothetical protein